MNNNMANIELTPMEDIHADWEWNCRGGVLSPVDVDDLVLSIKAHGLLQPVTIIDYPPWKENPGNHKYLLVVGYRRYRAHEVLGFGKIRAIVQSGIEAEEDAVLVNLAENMSRKQLSFKQEVNSVKRLRGLGLSLQKICKILNVSYGWGQQRFYASQLPNIVTDEINRGAINITSTRRLYNIYKGRKEREGVESGVAVLMEALKQLKGAKMSKRDPLKALERKGVPNKMRNKRELEKMQDRVIDLVGPCLTSKMMGWLAGLLSTEEIEIELKKECEMLECLYIPPED